MKRGAARIVEQSRCQGVTGEGRPFGSRGRLKKARQCRCSCMHLHRSQLKNHSTIIILKRIISDAVML
eukprot:3469904-Amphidinium_carterae.1